MSSFPYKRVVVVGVTGSGKSTLAERLAGRFDMHFIELDALHWEPGWQEAPLEVFRTRVEQATRAEKWVLAGNYRAVRDLTWPKAEAVIWLDYPLWTVFWQLTRRNFKRWWTRELLWGTNYEPLWIHFKIWSKESLYNWLFQTYWRRKKEYAALLSQPEHRHLKLIRLRHPKDTETWLTTLSKENSRMDIEFKKLTKPTSELAEIFERWENDPALIPLIRPNRDQAALGARDMVTVKDLEERLEHNQIYLIYLEGQLIGFIDYQVDPKHLYKKDPGTAWIGIVIGEETGRGRGIGVPAMHYLEEQIRAQGLKRIELGVFEFNTHAIRLYQKLGYEEFARIDDFTYWDGKMWQDIRMEKYL